MNIMNQSSLDWNFWKFGDVVEDLSLIDKSVKKLSLSPKAKNFSLLPEFKKLKKLTISGEQIREEKFEIVCEVKSLQALRIKWLQVKDLSSIGKLTNLEYLMLNSNSKTEDIAAIGNLTKLKELTLNDFQKVKDITPLSKLTNMVELSVQGGMWKTMKINSVKPLEKLSQLKILYMTNLRITDNSLRSISKLSKLKHLAIGNFFTADDVVYLKKKLPKTKCGWFSPIHELKYVSCKKCGKSMVLITGQGGRSFCPNCDSKKIEEVTSIFKKDQF